MANIFKSKYTGEQIEEILDKANNVTDITPNPTEEATEELEKITIGSTTYSIPKGVTVEGNPSGDATTELTKLKVGDTIYSIPQGSGGTNTLYKHSVEITIAITNVSFDLINDMENSYSSVNNFIGDFGCLSVGALDIIDSDGMPNTIYNAIISSGYTSGLITVYGTSSPSSTTVTIKHMSGVTITDTVTAI